jgi:hypothetical protein
VAWVEALVQALLVVAWVEAAIQVAPESVGLEMEAPSQACHPACCAALFVTRCLLEFPVVASMYSFHFPLRELLPKEKVRQDRVC